MRLFQCGAHSLEGGLAFRAVRAPRLSEVRASPAPFASKGC